MMCDFIKTRLKNIQGWTMSTVGCAMGYVWLPISFCFTNPTFYLSNRTLYKKSRQDESPLSKFSSNFYLIAEGTFTIITGGCCCCGCFTVCSPEDIYGE